MSQIISNSTKYMEKLNRVNYSNLTLYGRRQSSAEAEVAAKVASEVAKEFATNTMETAALSSDLTDASEEIITTFDKFDDPDDRGVWLARLLAEFSVRVRSED